jgi:hypothetical protein
MSNGRIKLGEAQYFLGQMRDTVSDHEAFAYNLSAFLSAARSVTLLLQGEFAHTPGFKEWWVREQDRLRLTSGWFYSTTSAWRRYTFVQ